VAPPLGMIEPSALGGITKPVALLAGDQDSYCPANHLAALAERLGPSAQLRLIPGADHFFASRENEITAALVEALAKL
jgi:pimeloyl-ACP methyl ester carboxylesterase